jgi:hypothetical protein
MSDRRSVVSAPAGTVVEVSLDRPANVLLLDSLNYDNYRLRRAFRYQGGLARKASVAFTVPHTGRWHVVVEPTHGEVQYALRVRRGQRGRIHHARSA